jgi:Tol biopolymer transport system component
MRLALEPGAEPVAIAATPFEEYTPVASPDGRWVAYQSDDSGRDEVFVRDASGSGGR